MPVGQVALIVARIVRMPCYHFRMAIRDTGQRKLDVLHKLEHERDVWVATADSSACAHLVPFSLSWDGADIIVATKLSSRSARNVSQSGQARLALGDTREVVILDVRVRVLGLDAAGVETSEQFTARNGWDPRMATGEWVYFFMTPITVQAWASEEELTGRMVMKKGDWLD